MSSPVAAIVASSAVAISAVWIGPSLAKKDDNDKYEGWRLFSQVLTSFLILGGAEIFIMRSQ